MAAGAVDVKFKQVAGVLLDGTGVGAQLDTSGKCALVIDQGGNVGTFLRYRDCNMLQGLNKNDLEEDKIRMALLGGLRFGKPFVLDSDLSDMSGYFKDQCEKIMPGLFDAILDKSITKEEKFTKLIKDGDDASYQKAYEYDRVDAFKFIILTKMADPPAAIASKMFVINVVMG